MRGRTVYIIFVGDYKALLHVAPVFSKKEDAVEYMEGQMLLSENEGLEFWMEPRVIDRELLL